MSATVRRVAGPDLSSAQLHDLLRLRSEVFVVEQRCAYQDVDGRDLAHGTEHWWIEADDQILSCARVLREPDGSTRLGRVATLRRARSEGHAATLIRAALEDAARPVAISAQAHLARWYRRFGFEIVGEVFVEDGIDHLPMRLR